MEDDIKKLWENVMVPNINSNYPLLNKLGESDYGKFFEFMISNSEGYDQLVQTKFKLEKQLIGYI